MVYKIQKANAKSDFVIEAVFFDGRIVEYDVKPLFLIFPKFNIFKTNKELFENVKVDQGGYGISWSEELDLDAKTIWEYGVLIERKSKTDINHLLAYQLLMARESQHITQKELSEKTGIYQADISKLERGMGNPSILTLKRLAEGLNMDLRIDFVVKTES